MQKNRHNLCGHSALKEGETISQPLSMDLLAKWLHFKEHNMRRVSRRILQWRNPTNRSHLGWWRSASEGMSHMDPVCPWCDMMGKAIYPLVFSLRTHKCSINMRKNMRLIQTEGHFTNYLTSTLKMTKVIKNKDGLRTCYSEEEPDVITIWNVGSWMWLWNRKELKVKLIKSEWSID